MNKVLALLTLVGAAWLAPQPATAHGLLDCHRVFAPHWRILYYRPVVHWRPVYGWSRGFHGCCHPLRHINPYAPYPETFIENAHVYVPPAYFYSPYSYVDHVLVHRSIEIGPEVKIDAPKPVVTFAAVSVL